MQHLKSRLYRRPFGATRPHAVFVGAGSTCGRAILAQRTHRMRCRREIVDSVATPDGRLDLARLDDDEWEILIDGRTLMTSRFNRSEIALGEMACRPLAHHRAPRIIVAGLGMGYTLRAALDALPRDAQVLVADLNSVVVDWCRWRLGELCDNVLDDPRVRMEIIDVGVPIARGASGDAKDRYDAIILDLYEGPYAVPAGKEDPLFGRLALERARTALHPHGCLAVWSEQPVQSFERRLRSSGFRCECRRPSHKGPHHVVYLAWPDERRGA
jgi:spermidine synthase